MNLWTCYEPLNGGSFTGCVTLGAAPVGAIALCVPYTMCDEDLGGSGSGSVSVSPQTHQEPLNGSSYTGCVILVVALVGAIVLHVHCTKCDRDSKGSHGNLPHCQKEMGCVASWGLQ